MHLTDQQLIEADYDEKYHLSQCQSCQQRLRHMLAIRQQLKSVAPSREHQEQWLSIKQDFMSHNQPLVSDNNKLHFWRLTSLSLTAFVAVLLLWQVLPIKESPSHSNELVKLIAKNNQLQQQLKQLGSEITVVRIKQLQLKLGELDHEIQQAYFDNLTDSHKISLWQQRQHLINNILIKHKQTKVMRI